MQMNWNEALDHYNLNYEVEKRPVYVGLGDGQSKLVDNLFSIVRTDTNKPLEGVGVNGRYTCIQAKSYADIGDKITGDLGAEFVKGAVLLGGKGLYLQAKLPDSIRVKGTDDILDKFITFVTDHSGRFCFSILPTSVRLFCENQIAAIMNDVSGVKIRHTANSIHRIKQADVAILNVMGAYSGLETKIEWLVDTKFNKLQMDLAIYKAFNIGDHDNLDDIPTRTKNNIEKVKELAECGKGNVQYAGSGWSLYNGFVEWSDHHRSVRKTTNTFESNLIGSGATFKNRALAAIEQIAAETI